MSDRFLPVLRHLVIYQGGAVVRFLYYAADLIVKRQSQVDFEFISAYVSVI